MVVLTLTDKDLIRLASRYNHLKDLDFSSLSSLKRSINIATGEQVYVVSEWISFAYGHVNGIDCVFIYGNGHAISESLGRNPYKCQQNG